MLKRAIGPAILIILALSVLHIGRPQILARGFMPGDTASRPGASTKEPGSRIIEAYGKLPLAFEANHGQTDTAVKFLSHGLDYSLFLTRTGATLALPTTAGHETRPTRILRMRLVGASREAKITGIEPLSGTTNYFIGSDPSKWRTNVPQFAKVRYERIYPGIDLVYYGNQGQLEYDFVVAPGAEPSVIRLAFDGAGRIERDRNGDLLLFSAAEAIRLRQPLIYQEENGIGKRVAGGYVLRASGEVAFEAAGYAADKPLVIDPILVYSTKSIGGSAMALDSAGNVYLAGAAIDYLPVTPGVFQGTYGGGFCSANYRTYQCPDAFVAKLNASGTALVYATYLGGSGSDRAVAIAVDAFGNAIVTGSTGSGNFPAASGIQAGFGGATCTTPDGGDCSDAFVAKLNATGSLLLYSTYLGGSAGDRGEAVAVDSLGNAYVTGSTNSPNFPVARPLQANLGGTCTAQPCQPDAFVAKLDPAGSTLVYSTYLGGTGADAGYGVAVTASGDAVVVGHTSADFPTIPGVVRQPAPSGFVVKLSPAGGLSFSSFLAAATIQAVALDSAGAIYLTGTATQGFPTTPGAFQTKYGGDYSDAFAAKLNATGSTLVYSTYLGGIQRDEGRAIAIDSLGNAYVAGFSSSYNFPAVSPLKPSCSISYDGFVTKFNPDGVPVFSSCLPRTAAFGIAVNSAGDFYLTGPSDSDLPTTPGAFQADRSLGFLVKISLAPSPVPRITSLDPASAQPGSPDLALTINGSDFNPNSVVRWNGSDRATTVVSLTQLQARIPAADLTVPGSAGVMVFTPAPGGGTSNTLTFTILGYPVPTVLSLRPASAPAGGPGFILTVTGRDFVRGASVLWNGQARPTTFQSNVQLVAAISAADVAEPAIASVAAVNPPPGGGISNALSLTVGAMQPVVNPRGVVNAASFAGGPVAAGSIVSLFGIGLARTTAAADIVPLPATLAGVSVQIGGLNAPLFFVSPNQINLQVPWDAEPPVVVTLDGVASNPSPVSIGSLAPGLFTLNATGWGQGAIVIADTGEIAAPAGSIPGRAARPVRPGEFISIYCTGLGTVTNRPPSGTPAPGAPLSLSSMPSVTIGGVPAEVSFAGLAPGFVGLYQVNALVPGNAPSGTAVPVQLVIRGVTSNNVMLAVE